MEVTDKSLQSCAGEVLKTFANLPMKEDWSFCVTSHPMCRNWSLEIRGGCWCGLSTKLLAGHYPSQRMAQRPGVPA